MYKSMIANYSPWMANKYRGISAQDAGAWLRQRRKDMGLRQQDVADQVNMSHPNQVLYLEKGKHDARQSSYLPEVLRVLGITVEEAREHLGLEAIYTHLSEADARIGAEPAPALVMVQNLGTVAAMRKDHDPKNKQVKKPSLTSCPLPIAKKYKPEEMFSLTVDGDSMACADVQRTIPNGAQVLFLRVPGRREPRRGNIVVAWVPNINTGVLKMFNKKDTQISLESYNPTGARFPAKQYPDMIIQGICLGFWVEFE